MKKILKILVLGLLLSGNAHAALATCSSGECEFIFGLHYVWAETDCLQSLNMEEVETSFMSFTIEETQEQCTVFNSR